MSLQPRYSTIQPGAMTFTGNTLGLSAAPSFGSEIGAFITINTASIVGGYPPGSTLIWQENSSSAVLNMPLGSTILYAELVWGGSYKTITLLPGPTPGPPENVSAFINNPISFNTPSGLSMITPSTITAQTYDFTDASGFQYGYYGRSADVTSLVQATGTYTVGGVPSTIQPSWAFINCCGWILGVIYKNTTLPMRSMNLYVGLSGQFSTSTPTNDITVSNFITPYSGPVFGRLLLSAMEGDSNIANDQALFGPNTGALVVLSGPNNIPTNFFASQINNDSGLLDTTGTDGTLNVVPPAVAPLGIRYGWDITNVNAPTLTNAQTSAVLRLTTSGDAYAVPMVGLQIDNQQILPSIKSVDKVYASVGDILTYTIEVQNYSTIPAGNVIIVDTIPTGTTFIPNSLTINSVPNSGNPSPPSGVNIGTIPSTTGVTTVTFKVLVNSTIPSPNPIQNIATINSEGGTPSNTNTVNTQINSAILSSTKLVDKSFATINDILTYTIPLLNTGNVPLSSVIFVDTIPTGTSFIPGSLTINGVSTIANPSPPGVNLGTIPAISTTTIGFKVLVTSFPSPNPIPNSANFVGTYTENPSIPNGVTESSNTNIVNTFINRADLSNITKSTDKDFATINDVITYTITIPNTGTTSANSVIF
ncbi:hypothetical protein, partial [Romboutsia sp.]|uniref:hypothetical protein n=1 Tax=Romboutsia sp. TaxID=1965302 RepID=UPI003F2D09C0